MKLWSDRDTVQHIYRPLYLLPTIKKRWCVVCGCTWPINQHHPVYLSKGECYDPETGREREKPTITLCGQGNTSGCHGKTHHGLLHFRNFCGEWQFLETEEAVGYGEALKMKGWRYVNRNLWPKRKLYAERGVPYIPF